MARLTRKLWTGLGTASLVGVAMTTPAIAQPGAKPTAQPSAKQGDAGVLAMPKAGEAYLTDGGPKDTRIRLYRDIALMHGHLLVGRELVELGNWDEALPHHLHPTEELYGALERYIKLHKVPPFDRDLKVLAQTVKARSLPAYARAAKVVDEKLTGTLQFFRRFMKSAPFTTFTAKTLVEVVKVAQSEYEAALEGERFAKPVEYQDGRGFVLFAERVLEAHAADFAKVDKSGLAAMRSAMADLKLAWPTPMPPVKPVVDVATVAARAKVFEQAATRFF